MHIQRCQLCGKINKFGGKSFKKLKSVEFMELFFPSLSSSQSGTHHMWKYLQNTFSTKPLKLGSWHFEWMFTSPHLSSVTCHVRVILKRKQPTSANGQVPKLFSMPVWFQFSFCFLSSPIFSGECKNFGLQWEFQWKMGLKIKYPQKSTFWWS